MSKPGAPAGSYSLSGFENINLFNGNLNFNLPLAKIGGRGKAQSSVNLTINSAKWKVERDPIDGGDQTVRRKMDGTVERVNFGGIGFSDFEHMVLDGTEVNYDGQTFTSFMLDRTSTLAAPGYYFESYFVEEETCIQNPGYAPGLLIARGGIIRPIRSQSGSTFSSLTRIYFIGADGTEYELRDTTTDGKPLRHTSTSPPADRGTTFLSPDGSGLKFVSDLNMIDFDGADCEVGYPSGWLYFPDGTKYRIDNGKVSLIRDVNGNQITYTYTSNKLTRITDSLGRKTEFTYGNDANDPDDRNLTYDEIKTQLTASAQTNSAAGWQIVKVYKTNLGNALRTDFHIQYLSELFPDLDQSSSSDPYNPSGIVKKVELPNGKSYDLFYNSHNEIVRVKLPTGAAIEYTFPASTVSGPGGSKTVIFRPVTKRRVYANGGSSLDTNSLYDSEQKYARDFVDTYPNQNSRVTVEEYSGNVNTGETPTVAKTDHYFYGSADSISHKFYPKWNEGREYKTEVFDTTTNLSAYGQLRQSSATEWEKPVNVDWGDTQVAKKVQVKSATMTVFESGKSLTQKTTYGYDNASVTNNKTDERISDFGINGTPGRNLKHNKTYYLGVNPENGIDYTSDTVYLPGLPIMSETYEVNNNGSDGPVISRTEVKYDETNPGLLLVGATTGWVNPDTQAPRPRGNATTSIIYNLSGGGSVATHTQFDQLGNARKNWDARGMMSEMQYDPALGSAFPTKSISPKPAPAPNSFGASEEFISTTNYDLYTGLVNNIIDANNQTAQTSYIDPATNAQDLLLRPHKVTAPNGQQTVFEYGDQIGSLNVKVKKQIDATNWSETTSYIDGLGRTYKTQTKDAAGDIFTETEFDNMGRVKRKTNPYRANETKLWSETQYDALGRAVETFAPKASGRGDSLGITSYDLATGGDSIGTVVVTTDAAGRKSRSITNALGQLIRVDEPSATNTLDPLPSPTPPPSPTPSPTPGPSPSPTPRCAGLLPNPGDPCLTGGDYPVNSTYYKYDALGRMVEVTQGGQKRYFLYDTLGRLLRVRQPEQQVNASLDTTGNPGNNSWTAGFTYDENGNVRTATDANGVTITSDYDQLNRVKTRTYSGEAQGHETPTVYFTYDGIYYDAGNGVHTAQNPFKGTLTQMRNGISTSQTTKYDALGRATEYQQITDGVTYTSKYAYNFDGALIEETYPDGRVVKNEFNADGDLSRVYGQANANAPVKTYVNSLSYTAAGGINQMRLGNGRWETAKFNSRLQMTELGLGNSATDASLWKVAYDYGELSGDGTSVNQAQNTGNIARQTISFQGLAEPFVQSYRYDSLYRLTEAREVNGTATQANWVQQFGYDRFGNRTSFAQNLGGTNTLDTPAIDAATNRFAETADLGYDKNGNIIKDAYGAQARRFTFNGDNKQTEIRDANIAVSTQNPDANLIGRYSYDGDGKRVKKETNTETTVFVYSGGKLIQEYSTKLAVQPSINYTTSDYLATPRIITDELGQAKARRDFMPFGEELLAGVGGRTGDTGQKYSASKDEVRQKFTGYQKDDETQLDYAEARYYDHAHGRFTAVDPLLASGKSANPQTFNRYAYTGNNPIARTDSGGKDWVDQTVTRVTYGRTFTTHIPVWHDFAAGRNAWTKNVYRVGYGGGKGLWTALDPYSGNFKQFKTRAEAVTAYNGFLSQRNADAIGGAVRAAADTVDGMVNSAVPPLLPKITPARDLANSAMNAAGINPNESSDVFRSANNGTNVVITTGSVIGGETIPALVEGRAAETAGAVGNASQCFIAGTLIHTADGLLPIEKIKAGNKVLSYNEGGRQVEYQTVLRTFVNHSSNLFEVRVEGQSEPIVVTNGHPFYMHRARSNLSADEGEWINSDKLEAGDLVRKPDGTWVRVISINRIFGEANVYNFEVENNHDYFVGSAGVLVHNQTTCGGTPNFIGQANGPAIAVPEGSTATPVVNGQGNVTGFGFRGGSGGNGLNDAVDTVRIMDPTNRYPNGYVTYMNSGRQGINPFTGRTIPNSDPLRHIPLSPP